MDVLLNVLLDENMQYRSCLLYSTNYSHLSVFLKRYHVSFLPLHFEGNGRVSIVFQTIGEWSWGHWILILAF